MSGNFFESFVVGEVLKSFQNAGVLEPPLYFYRDRDKNEIDLLIENNGVLYPIEIKQSSTPAPATTSAFEVLSQQRVVKIAKGCVVCLADRLLPLNDQAVLVPYRYL
jgi:predicted AAA+ superfamily ATPase